MEFKFFLLNNFALLFYYLNFLIALYSKNNVFLNTKLVNSHNFYFYSTF